MRAPDREELDGLGEELDALGEGQRDLFSKYLQGQPQPNDHSPTEGPRSQWR